MIWYPLQFPPQQYSNKIIIIIRTTAEPLVGDAEVHDEVDWSHNVGLHSLPWLIILWYQSFVSLDLLLSLTLHVTLQTQRDRALELLDTRLSGLGFVRGVNPFSPPLTPSRPVPRTVPSSPPFFFSGPPPKINPRFPRLVFNGEWLCFIFNGEWLCASFF